MRPPLRRVEIIVMYSRLYRLIIITIPLLPCAITIFCPGLSVPSSAPPATSSSFTAGSLIAAAPIRADAPRAHSLNLFFALSNVFHEASVLAPFPRFLLRSSRCCRSNSPRTAAFLLYNPASEGEWYNECAKPSSPVISTIITSRFPFRAFRYFDRLACARMQVSPVLCRYSDQLVGPEFEYV